MDGGVIVPSLLAELHPEAVSVDSLPKLFAHQCNCAEAVSAKLLEDLVTDVFREV